MKKNDQFKLFGLNLYLIHPDFKRKIDQLQINNHSSKATVYCNNKFKVKTYSKISTPFIKTSDFDNE